MSATTLPATTANPATLMRVATDAANVCAEIVKRGCVTIKGKRYPTVETWQSIAAAFGCTLSAGAVEQVPGGFRAIGEVRRLSDGAVISTAEGFCGTDETEWARRPVFARRAMAQTRAQSRAARAAFAFVVLLIDRNLSTIPAEEIPARGTPEDVTPPAADTPAPAARPASAPAASGTRKGGGIFAKPAKPAPAATAADTGGDDPADGEARAILADLIGEREDAANRLLEGRGLIPEGGSFRDLAADKVRELVANPIRLRKAIAAAEGGQR